MLTSFLARLASPYAMMTPQGMMAPMMQPQVMMTPQGQLVQGMRGYFFFRGDFRYIDFERFLELFMSYLKRAQRNIKTHSQKSGLDSVKITIMVACSWNMASLIEV